MLTKPDFPAEGELVICTVTNVPGFGAFVKLDEYPGREGFIHIAEIAPGWVKRIRNHVREQQRVVCKVTGVDKEKGHIDLSLKSVNEHQKREKIQEWKNSQKSEKLFSMVAEKLGKTPDECYEEFGQDLVEQYGSLYAAFEECAYAVDTLKNDGFTGEWLDAFAEIASDNIVIPTVTIKGYISVETWLPDGVHRVQKALAAAEKSNYEDVDIEVKHIGAPRYSITVTAPDYKVAENEMKEAADRATQVMEDNGTVEFKRELEEQ